MKYLLISIFLCCALTFINCSKDGSNAEKQNGFLQGTVTDGRGLPLQGVKIIIDNSLFFNRNLSTTTNSSGTYKIAIPVGSWYAFAQLQKMYNGKNYQFYLHSENPAGFGKEGGQRNFSWKLTGEKPEPLSGYYGGLVTFDNYPGSYIEAEQDIEFTFIPSGKLIDGSDGTILKLKAADAHQLHDIPIGRYRVSASYHGEQLLLRKWNSEEVFAHEVILDFEPQIPQQCDNCFKLEYKLNRVL